MYYCSLMSCIMLCFCGVGVPQCLSVASHVHEIGSSPPDDTNRQCHIMHVYCRLIVRLAKRTSTAFRLC